MGRCRSRSSDYNTDSNWTTSPAPTAPVALGDTAIFSNTGVTGVNVSAPIGPTSWIFDANALAFAIGGSDVQFSNIGAGGGIVNNANTGLTIEINNNLGELVLPVQIRATSATAR